MSRTIYWILTLLSNIHNLRLFIVKPLEYLQENCLLKDNLLTLEFYSAKQFSNPWQGYSSTLLY